MAVPFSNTTLRVPRGFGNLLEGLAREVLRDQPDDIPTFAALYFTELLRAREESGIDPAEWGAKLEDRFYNSHAFKETATQGNSGSAEASRRDKAGHSETFGNNRTEDSTLKDLNANNASDNLENVEEQQRYNLDKKLDEESGETEHEAAPELPNSGTPDDPNEILEEAPENAQVQKENKKANEFVDVNICRSELEPTSLPSFGGLANVDVCAEEINRPLDGPSESTENRGLIDAVLESPKPLLQDGEQSESQGMQVSHDQLTESLDETLGIEQDTDEQANEMSDGENTEEPDFDSDTEEAEQRVSENTDALLNDNGPEEKSTEQGYLESAESTAAREKDRTETNNTSTAEAGHKTEEHIEEKDDIQDSEDQEETNHEYSSTNDFADDEPADTTNYTSDNNARSLMDMKGNENDDETCDSQSEVIDVLDEVVMSTGHQCPTNTGEHEDGNSLDEQTSSEIMNRLTEEELLAAQTDALEPDSQMTGNDSDTDVTEDVTDGKILNTDVTDTSEKELITENINDESDFDSDGSDAKEIAEDEIAKYVQESYNDVSNTHQQDTMKTDDEENIETNDPELTEDVLPTDVFVHGTEEAHHWPLSDGTEGEAEAMIEHPRESQTHPEYNETNKDQEYHLEDQGGEIQESTNERENMANPESLREQEEECSQPQEEEDIMDIPLDDPEANKAAAKIQAGFRGHMTRKKMKPGEKPSEEVSSSGEALNGSQGDTGGTDGVETDATSGPEQ